MERKGTLRDGRRRRSRIDMGCNLRLLALNAQSGLLWVGPVPEVGLELGAALIQCDCMSKGPDNRIGSGEGKAAGDETDRVDGVPTYA